MLQLASTSTSTSTSVSVEQQTPRNIKITSQTRLPRSSKNLAMRSRLRQRRRSQGSTTLSSKTETEGLPMRFKSTRTLTSSLTTTRSLTMPCLTTRSRTHLRCTCRGRSRLQSSARASLARSISPRLKRLTVTMILNQLRILRTPGRKRLTCATCRNRTRWKPKWRSRASWQTISLNRRSTP